MGALIDFQRNSLVNYKSRTRHCGNLSTIHSFTETNTFRRIVDTDVMEARNKNLFYGQIEVKRVCYDVMCIKNSGQIFYLSKHKNIHEAFLLRCNRCYISVIKIHSQHRPNTIGYLHVKKKLTKLQYVFNRWPNCNKFIT